MVGIRSPVSLVVGSCTSHPGVLGSIPKREDQPGPPDSATSPVLARPVCLFVCVGAASLPCARPLLPSSDRSAGQRNQPSHSTVLARPVCPFVCVSAASFPCRILDLGLNFLLASACCTRARLSFPAVYVGVVECAPTSPYTYSSSTHRFPDERTPIEVQSVLYVSFVAL